jgi:hypothetical protein
MKDDRYVRELPHPWIEGLLTGLGYSTALASLSVFLVGSFRPSELPSPYWVQLRWLRTDTFGFGCFVIAATAITLSEYLRLSRTARRQDRTETASNTSLDLFALSTSRTLVAAGSLLVVYLSVNNVTHPQTLELQATHLLSWPTESTLRATALVVTACAVAVSRILRIAKSER